jgi:hypothetical protein
MKMSENQDELIYYYDKTHLCAMMVDFPKKGRFRGIGKRNRPLQNPHF